MTNEILIAGFGGQGILFAGKLLAYLGLIQEKEVSWLPSYGPEMRGGTCNCSVCISDNQIGSPLILNPDYLIAMNAPSYDKFINSVKATGKAFIDNSLVSQTPNRKDIEYYHIPATELASQNNLKGAANIIMVGKLLKETSLADMETVKKAVQKIVPSERKHLIDLNLTAIQIGMEH